jgi:hypothetical protein
MQNEEYNNYYYYYYNFWLRKKVVLSRSRVTHTDFSGSFQLLRYLTLYHHLFYCGVVTYCIYQ